MSKIIDTPFLSGVLAPLAKCFETLNSQQAKAAGLALPAGSEEAYTQAHALLKPLILRKLAKKFAQIESGAVPVPPTEAVDKIKAALTAAMQEAGKEILAVRSGEVYGVIHIYNGGITFEQPELVDDDA